LENAECVRFSAKTNEGLDGLKTALRRVIAETAERDDKGPFLLHVERSFQLKGLGTIVSGIPRSGTLNVGDDVEMLPEGTKHRVRGLQVYGNNVETARAGECAALRLSDISREAAERGTVISLPGYFRPQRFMNVRFLYLPQNVRPLDPRTAIMFHVGTSETPGHLILPSQEKLAPGTETYAQIQLDRPAVAAPGDFYLVRRRSPAATLGGGTVIDCTDTKLRRGRGTWLEDRKAAEEAAGDDCRAMLLALDRAGDDPCHIDNWARQASVTMQSAKAAAATLASAGSVIALPGDRCVTATAAATARDAFLRRMAALHDEHPLHRGFEKKTICLSFPGSRLVLDHVFASLLEDGTLVAEGPRFFLKEREAVLGKAQQGVANNIVAIYEGARYDSPRPDSLPERLHISQRDVDEFLANLKHRDILVQLEDHVWLHARWVNESRELLEAHLRKARRIDAGTFKELIKASRKFAVPLLEYWDRMGLTRREGNDRVLREHTTESNEP
jgi:selenocysteine-specific elongation factor